MLSLSGMTMPFQNPYIIFYATGSLSDTSFPVNKAIQEIRSSNVSSKHRRGMVWRGNIVIAKYRSRGLGDDSDPFLSMTDISISDYTLLKNYFLNHEPLRPEVRRRQQLFDLRCPWYTYYLVNPSSLRETVVINFKPDPCPVWKINLKSWGGVEQILGLTLCKCQWRSVSLIVCF